MTNRLKAAEVSHVPFCDNRDSIPKTREALADTRQLVADLEEPRQRPMRPFTIRDNEEISIVRSLTGEEYPVGTTGEGFMNEGRLAVRSSLWDQNRPDNSTGDASTGPPRIPPTGGEASAALPVPMSSPEAVTSKRCRIPAHEHGILVTLHSVECKGAQLELLARVTPDEAQALADAACEAQDHQAWG